MRNLFLILTVPPLLSACSIAKTAVDVVTLPVKVASAGIDAITTSQRKADEKRGREIRKEEERRGREARLAQERCRKGKPLPADYCAAVQPH